MMFDDSIFDLAVRLNAADDRRVCGSAAGGGDGDGASGIERGGDRSDHVPGVCGYIMHGPVSTETGEAVQCSDDVYMYCYVVLCCIGMSSQYTKEEFVNDNNNNNLLVGSGSTSAV